MKMKNFQKLYLFFVILMPCLAACAAETEQKKLSIMGTWKLEKVIYDDSSSKNMDEGNYIEIHGDYILEIIRGYGKRRYSYTKKDNILNLISGNENISWLITQHEDDKLRIKTPIGLYVLNRKPLT
ncbi:MAG TPA: hypothetical protein ENJ08_01585 [Gammaproteobacteria bacterium]|nr:hypothetical protein [Gammaproteobacteria bacterium]